MILAADLGGTKTLVGLYEQHERRPALVAQREYVTLDHDGVVPMLLDFLGTTPARGVRVESCAIGVAGPIRAQTTRLTNVPWDVSAADLRRRTGIELLVLLNDVEAMGYCVEALEPDELVVLQDGPRQADGNAALLAPGTGMGQAILHRVGGRLVPVASEGGHVDFAARTEREIALLRYLRPRFGRVDVERVASGPGLANVARFTHDGVCPWFPQGLEAADEPAAVTGNALDRRCDACREALDMFVEALGAITGNLALTAVATGGVFLGGGIPPKILPALQAGSFRAAFNAKAPIEELLKTIPVMVITVAHAGLLGAAVFASRLARHAG